MRDSGNRHSPEGRPAHRGLANTSQIRSDRGGIQHESTKLQRRHAIACESRVIECSNQPSGGWKLAQVGCLQIPFQAMSEPSDARSRLRSACLTLSPWSRLARSVSPRDRVKREEVELPEGPIS